MLFSSYTKVDNTYKNIRKAYAEIFETIGLPAIPVAADNGAMGGKKSEEYMLLSPIGEDTILYDSETKTMKHTSAVAGLEYAVKHSFMSIDPFTSLSYDKESQYDVNEEQEEFRAW